MFLKVLLKHILWLSVAVNTACTKPSLYDAPAYEFPGLQNAQVTASGQVNLIWEKVPTQENVTYSIYRRLVNQETDFSKPIKVTVEPNYIVDKYSLNEKYCFSVRYNIAEYQTDSNTKEFCPTLPYVGEFTGITSAEVVGAGAVKLKWASPKDATNIKGFYIYSDSGFSVVKDTATADATEKIVTDIAVDSTGTFGIRAFDEYGRVDANTKTVSVKVVNNASLAFKGLESATKNSARSIKLTWLTPPGIAKEFRLYKVTDAFNASPTVTYSTVFKTLVSETSEETITDLGDEQTHCFVLRSVSTGGQEDSNTETKCVSLPDAGAPAFLGLKTAEFTEGAALLKWDAAVGETTKYKVYYKSGSSMDFATATVAEVSAPATSFTISGLVDNQNWSFAVRAIDSHNQADANLVSRTVFAGDLTPPVFNGIVSLVTVAGSETELTMTFNKSTDLDLNFYRFRYRISGATTWTEASTTITPTSSATIDATLTQLLPATTYDVMVRAYDTSGNPSTNTAFLTRKTNDATAPTFNGITNVAAKPGDISKARLTWNTATDAGGIKEYRVYYSTQSLAGKTLVRTATYPLTVGGQTINMSSAISSGTTADISGLSENTLYYFVVHAIDNSDNEDNNTAQQSYVMPFFTPPVAPTGLAFSGGAGPTTNRSPFITGTSTAGYSVKIYVDGNYNNTQVINSTGTFTVQLVPQLANTSGNYAITATHVNPSGLEGPTAIVGTYQLQIDTPIAVLTGGPVNAGTNNMTALAVTVGGTTVAQYKYSLMMNQSTTCENAVYSAWTAIATSITESTGTDGIKRLCVVAKSAAGIEQDVAAATQVDWTKNTVKPDAPTFSSIKNPVTNSATITFSPEILVTLNAATGASKYCLKLSTTTPVSTDACWSTSLAQTIVLGLYGDVYAWSMDAIGNISATYGAGAITYFGLCDSGDLATGHTCTISTAKTLSDNQHIGGQGNLIISSSGSLTGNATERSTITVLGDVTIASGAGNRILANITINANNLTINGTISANSLGYQGVGGAAGEPGASGGGFDSTNGGNCGFMHSSGGGGHAGAGGKGGSGNTSSTAIGGEANSLLVASAPITFGGSGGSVLNQGSLPGGAGGGAIKFNVTNLFTLSSSGMVSTKGENGTRSGSCNTGGGAGGSIWILAGSVSGTGTLSTQGGLGAGSNPSSGSGGGGAISITSSNPFRGTINIDPGIDFAGTANAEIGQPGKLTVNYSNPCNSGSLTTTCTISSSLMWGTNQTFSVTGDLVVANGGILKSPLMQFISIAVTGSITIENGGSILANLSNVTSTLFTIQSGGVVSADGLGTYLNQFNYFSMPSSYGKTGANSAGSGGGGHGGAGGGGSNNGSVGGEYANLTGSQYMSYGGGRYGSYLQPVTFGGPGAKSNGTTLVDSMGGGAIKISSTTLVIDGTLSANGTNGGTYSGNWSGGGAGGSLWLNVSSLSGSGTIRSNGGNSTGVGGGTANGGGGGGGRIAIYSSNKFAGTLQANGGSATLSAKYGEAGTIYYSSPDNYCDGAGTLATTCTISRLWMLPSGFSLTGTGNLVIAAGGTLQTYLAERASISMSGNVTIQSGGTLKGNFTVSSTNFSLNSGGIITAKGMGYLANYNATGDGESAGGGGSVSGGAGGAAGGGHGGAGGLGTTGASVAGASFGTAAAPTTFGAAGGSANSYGGSGGGAVRINVTGLTDLSGTIDVSGVDGGNNNSNGASGGGAGGSIYVNTAAISGTSCTLSATGGAGSTYGGTPRGGGGGGGRVRLTYTSISGSFTGNTYVTGGAGGGSTATSGSAGSYQAGP